MCWIIFLPLLFGIAIFLPSFLYFLDAGMFI
jgi:hypothetical protein